MSERYTLPDAAEIIRRLNTVSTDPFFQKFFKVVARDANRTVIPEGVIMLLTLAQYDFLQENPTAQAQANDLIIAMPRIIEALLVDNTEAQKAALKHWALIEHETTNERYEMTDTDRSRVLQIIGGVPGSIRVVSELFSSYGTEVLDLLEQQNLAKDSLWILYHNLCKDSYTKTMESLRDGSAKQKVEEFRQKHEA